MAQGNQGSDDGSRAGSVNQIKSLMQGTLQHSLHLMEHSEGVEPLRTPTIQSENTARSYGLSLGGHAILSVDCNCFLDGILQRSKSARKGTVEQGRLCGTDGAETRHTTPPSEPRVGAVARTDYDSRGESQSSNNYSRLGLGD